MQTPSPLAQRITEDMKAAMRAKDAPRLLTIRMLTAAMKQKEVDERVTLTDTDVDNPANTFQPVSSATASDSGFGSFTMTADGVWSYALDNSNAAVQALNFGTLLTDSFTVHAADGTAQIVTVNILGFNDAAVIAGTTLGMLAANVPVVLLGRAFADRLPLKAIHYGAAALFIVLGIVFLVRAY